MNYYQARIAYDTAQLLEELKKIYETKEGVTVTKGNVIMKAYQDSMWVDNWLKIHNEYIKLPHEYELAPSALKLRVQISEEVEVGIKSLKEIIAKQFKHKITIGVCLRLIFKAAYLKNTNAELVDNELPNIIFEKYKKELKEIFENANSEVENLLERLQKEISKKV